MIYFDNAASSYPKPPSVSRAVSNWLRKNGANPGRSGHKPAIEASQLIFDTRTIISELFGVEDVENIAFVPNATYGLNMLIHGLLEHGDHAVTTDLEHNSVLRPLYLSEKAGVTFSVAQVDLYNDDATVENILRCIKNNTKLVICTQCSNVCGKVMPIRKIASALPNKVKLLVDGSQGAGIIPIDLANDNVDYYCAPSHKGILGPQGSGFAVIRSDVPRPIIVGGTGSDSFNKSQPDYMPDALESGTLPTPVIAGMYEGLKFIKNVGIENIYQAKRELTKYLASSLKSLDNVITYIDADNSDFVGVYPFNIKNENSDEIAQYLSSNGICVRSGIHCAPLFHKKMGTERTGMVRVGLGYYNNKTEIRELIRVVNKYKKNKNNSK